MANDKKKPSIASQGAVMRRVLRYIGPHVSLVVLSLALCLISVALTLYVPILVGRAVDCIVGPIAVDFAALTPILMTIAVCIVITAAARRYFYLQDRPGLDIHHEDARMFLNRAARWSVMCAAFPA